MTALQVDRTSVLPTNSERLRSLDGLRGLAAVTVVIGHARLVVLQNDPSDLFEFPVIAEVVALLGTLGAHAVWLFFVLSGLVLSRMMLATKDFDYGSYVLGRLARLYIPVWAAVAFTFVTMLVASRDTQGLGDWVDAHPASFMPWAVINDLTLVGGASSNLSPLWSLRWEVLFSLLLILYVAVMRKIPPAAGVALSIVLCVIGQRTGNQVLMFMAMFAVGTALAFAWDRLTRLRDGLEARMRGFGVLHVAATLVAVLLIFALQMLPTLLRPLEISAPTMGMIDMGATLVALAAAIVLVGLARPLVATFEARPLQWLGTISFSLYLVHEPVLLFFVYTFRANPVAVAVGLVLCFPIAQLFFWAIEKPSHKFSRRFKRVTP